MNAPLSDSLSPQAQTVPSFDFISCQKSRVFLSGHRKKCLGTDDLKEGMLPSCSSNSNLRRSSLTNTPRPFQPHLEATAMTRGTKKHAFPLCGWGKARVPTCSMAQQVPTLTLPAPKGILPPRDKTSRSCSPPETSRGHQGPLHSCSDSPTAWRPHCFLKQLPGASQCLPRAGLGRSCHNLPELGETIAFTWPTLPFFKGRENEVRRGKATWSQ